MYKAKRAKRDTVENIYRQCKISGTCPDDVVNKVEQNTLADILLKIFGSVIYLGGLGIGSGSGAGATGFRPITENIPLETLPPTDTVPDADIPLVRPSRPTRPFGSNTFGTRIDPIGSAANRPRPVDPQGPAIVPLNEGGLPDPTIISTGAGPGSGINDYEILTTTDVFEDLSTVNGHPTVLHGQEDIAILQVTPPDPIPPRLVFENPTEPGAVIIESSVPPPEFLNVYVDPSYTGIQVGEEIELEPINTIEQFELEENIPRTSTPARVLESAVTRVRGLYNRFVDQVGTRNIDFLGQPSRAVLFEYDNPAFDPDVTLTFERDLQEVAAAPDPDFTDIIRLDRPIFSETEEGLLRVSRMGTKGKVTTRSGNILTQNVHYYYDISPISTIVEEIELQPMQDTSDLLTVVDELSQNTFINPVFEDNFPIGTLEDDFAESFAESHLALLDAEENENIVVPTLVSDISPKVVAGDYYSSFTTIGATTYPEIPLNTNIIPYTPVIQIDPFGSDFYLHPALLKRRKRKYSEIF